jgi:hypothetical protein
MTHPSTPLIGAYFVGETLYECLFEHSLPTMQSRNSGYFTDLDLHCRDVFEPIFELVTAVKEGKLHRYAARELFERRLLEAEDELVHPLDNYTWEDFEEGYVDIWDGEPYFTVFTDNCEATWPKFGEEHGYSPAIISGLCGPEVTFLAELDMQNRHLYIHKSRYVRPALAQPGGVIADVEQEEFRCDTTAFSLSPEDEDHIVQIMVQTAWERSTQEQEASSCVDDFITLIEQNEGPDCLAILRSKLSTQLHQRL